MDIDTSSIQSNLRSGSFSEYEERSWKLIASKIIFTIFAFILLTPLYMGVMLYYVPFPFIANSKGLSPSKIGLIMGLLPFVNIFTFPITSTLVNRLSLKLVFALSAIAECILLSLFGLLPYMERTQFEFYSFLFPILFSLPISFFYNSNYAILQVIFPNHSTLILTLQYIFFSSAYLLGPPVGSILYRFIGYFPMFLLFGICGVVVAIIAMVILYFSPIILHNNEREKGNPLLILNILASPSVSLNLIFIFITSANYFYFLPVMGPYFVSRYNIAVPTIGSILIVSETSHLLLALPLGYLINRWSSTPYYCLIGCGLFLHATGIFLYAPVSNVFSTRGNYLPLTYAASIIIGFGFGLSYVPTMSVSLNRGKSYFPNSPNVSTIISGLIAGTYSVGEGMGPLIVLEWRISTLLAGSKNICI